MLRYSLKSLGAVVTLIAVACAALMHARPWVASTAWTLLLVLLSLATIAAVFSAPERRGFWTGFSLAGWLYLAAIGPLAGTHQSALLTTMALKQAAALLPQEYSSPPPPVAVVPGGSFTFSVGSPQFITTFPANPSSGWTSYPPLQPATVEPSQSFVDIGQSLWALLLALLGGWFGVFVVSRRGRSAIAVPSRAGVNEPA
jgi:hypothetical protein